MGAAHASSRTEFTLHMRPRELWHLFNLRDTPYFQEALRPEDGARYPVDWFVGREAEADRLTATILGHSGSSRQSIRGSVGVGKSTLAQYVKATLSGERMLSNADAVALGHADGADEVSIRILSYVYEALIAAGQERQKLAALERDESVQSTRQIVRSADAVAARGHDRRTSAMTITNARVRSRGRPANRIRTSSRVSNRRFRGYPSADRHAFQGPDARRSARTARPPGSARTAACRP